MMQSHAISETLNKHCHCITLDKALLKTALDSQIGQTGFAAQLDASHPHLFCNTATFISAAHLQEMQALVQASRQLAARPAYQQWALAQADPVAQKIPGHDSVFFGYDFHIDAQGPHLIEINTNAGGGLLNALLSQAQQACCENVSRLFQPLDDNRRPDLRLLEMFRMEWALSRGEAPLRSIAIVDDTPEQQGLYPEFLLFQSLFERHGIHTVIVSPNALRIDNHLLRCGDQIIDMVYSRVTDFYFTDAAHAVLRDAWLNDYAVITPHPRAYALFADKRCMTVMSSKQQLQEMGVEASDQALFERCVPLTRLVSKDEANLLWAERKHLFFKPAQGYGSKAAYRGDKLTRKVFEALLEQEGYVVQQFSPPGQRSVQVEGADSELKFDVRAYVYRGDIQLLAARVYQGQTTNMRTRGGGFSGVFLVPGQPG